LWGKTILLHKETNFVPAWKHVKKAINAQLRQSLNLLLYKIHDDNTLGCEKHQANIYPNNSNYG
jgi:hypothetical protein